MRRSGHAHGSRGGGVFASEAARGLRGSSAAATPRRPVGRGRFSPGGRCPAAWESGRAFTLIELLTVLAIVAILSAIVLGAGRRVTEAGRIARAKAELAALAAALEGYRRQQGEYPATGDAAVLLQSLIGKRGPMQAAVSVRARIDLARFATDAGKDPFSAADAVLVDPWGQPYRYIYKVPAAGWTNPGYVLYSIGPDGRDAPALLAGGEPDTAADANRDNLHAHP